MEEEPKHKRRSSICPNCGAHIVIHVETTVKEVTLAIDNSDPDERWMKDYTSGQISMVKSARESGAMSAFDDAIKVAFENQRPRCIERVFLNFIKMAVPYELQREEASVLKSAMSIKDKMDVWHSNGILGVGENGYILRFVPLKILRNAKNGNGLFVRGIEAFQEKRRNWLRTRWGYVAGKGIFFEEMQKHSLGEFVSVRLKT